MKSQKSVPIVLPQKQTVAEQIALNVRLKYHSQLGKDTRRVLVSIAKRYRDRACDLVEIKQ